MDLAQLEIIASAQKLDKVVKNIVYAHNHVN